MRLAAAPSASCIHVSHCSRVRCTVSKADEAVDVLCCYQKKGWHGQSLRCALDNSNVNCKANLLLNGILLQAEVGLDDFLKAWRWALELLEDCPVQGLLPAGTVWHKLSDVHRGEVCNCTSAAAVTSQRSSQGFSAGVAR